MYGLLFQLVNGVPYTAAWDSVLLRANELIMNELRGVLTVY